MTATEQAKKYLDAIPPAVSGQGGHDQTFIAARALVWGFDLPEHIALDLLRDWNQGCQPPWSERELEHKIQEAASRPYDKPRGHLLSSKTKRVSRYSMRPAPTPQTNPELPSLEYDLTGHEDIELPQGIWNGFGKILENCFKPEEGVRIMSAIDDDSPDRRHWCNPDGGLVLPRDEWLKRAEEREGGINGLLGVRQNNGHPGIFLGINPMKERGKSDKDVTDYRHCLLEFDKISLTEQWLLIQKSHIPCAAVLWSGGKSIHAWVKIDAGDDRKLYDERVLLLYNHFKAYRPDTKNKNPSRFSRCPDAYRKDEQQMLLALNIGAETFSDWSKNLMVQGIGVTMSTDEILDFKPEEDEQTIVGDNFIRRGGSCILVGPSGIGKSSLARQICYCWALGWPAFGISPSRPLKILMIQAENDMADLHEMDYGIASGLGIVDNPMLRAQLRQNLVTNHNVADTGHDFVLSMQRLADRHEPDLVMVDPLLSFIGDDISKQEVVGRFCRNWLNPVLLACNFAFMAIHHTGKPPAKEPKAKGKKGRPAPRQSLIDLSYNMMGSSELTNWARATCSLVEVDGGYELLMCKRGKRAGAKHPNGMSTRIVRLQHSPDQIYWVQTDPPEEVATATETEAPEIVPSRKIPGWVAAQNLNQFLSKIPENGWRFTELCSALGDFAAHELGVDLGDPGKGTSERTVKALIQNHKLTKKGVRYIKGSNA